MPSARPSTAAKHIGGKPIASRWWRANDKKVHEEVFATVAHIRSSSERRRTQDMHHMRLYGNLDVAGAGWQADRRTMGDDGRMRYNLCSSAVDTAASMIAQQRPKPMYLTQEGDYGLQRQSRLRTRVLEGQLYDLQAYEIMPEVFIDAAVLGTGCVYGYLHPDTGEPCIERVLPLELFVDHQDGLSRKPRSLYRRRLIAREVLEELYPDCADAIKNAQGPSNDDKTDFWLNRDTTVDQVVVIEAWHLPSKKRGKDDKKAATDGKHVIAVSSGKLVTEAWEHEQFPIAFYRWKKRQVGFWGMGIVEECRDGQVQINEAIARSKELRRLGANTWLLVDQNAEVRVEKITNQPVSIIRWNSKGARPEFMTVNPTPPELQAEINNIREQTFSQLGISAMTAEGKKPAGLDSGAAQRAHEDITSRRHIMNARGYEDGYMELVRLLEMLNETAADNDNGLTLMSRTQRGRTTLVKQVDWKAVKLPENKYRLTMFPTSALPSTPAGKMAAVSEWIASGFISRPYAQQLLDFPDLDAAARMELADLDSCMHDVEKMLDGEAAYPEPFQDLALAADTCRKAYLQARCQGAPESVLELMREYMDDCKQLLQPPVPPQTPQNLPADAMVPGGQDPLALPAQSPMAPSMEQAGGPMM
jgi:hypothetical protein